MGEGFKWYDVHLIVCLSVANCAYVTLVYENCQKIPTSVKIPDNVKIVMSAYLSDKWSDYDEIWYTSSDSDSDKNDLTTIQILKFNTADGRHIENIGRGLSDFCELQYEDTRSESIDQNLEIQDGGRSKIVISPYLSEMPPGFDRRHVVNFDNSRWRTDLHRNFTNMDATIYR